MSGDLSTATEGTRTDLTTARSLTGNLWWLLPPAAALFYPLAVRALYESGKLLHRASGTGDVVARLAIAVSVALVYGVPAVGIGVAYRLGRDDRTSSSELFARRLAHLAVASPSLFVLIGVVFYLLHSPNSDSVSWWILWLAALAAAVWAMSRQGADRPATSTSNPIPLRFAHGTSALLIVLIFLAWHLLNHASAAFSLEVNRAMLNTLRKWYRSELVEPVLVTLMLSQMASGVILFWRATASRSDLYRTLQTSTGAFLTVFIVSHLNAVFILGRAVPKVDTNFLVGVRRSGGSPARRVERAADRPLLSRRLVRDNPHGTRSSGRVALSQGIASRSRPCRVGCVRTWGGSCTDDHHRTTKRPRAMTPRVL